MFVMVVLLGTTADDFIDALPGFQQQFQALLGSWTDWLAGRGLDVSRGGLSEAPNPATAMGFFGGLLSGLVRTVGIQAPRRTDSR